jgi:hypothetical protein
MLQRLRAGSAFRDACALAGIDWRQWKRWRKVVEDDNGTTGDPDRDALVRDAREAHSAATADLMAHITAAAPADWKAAAWAVEYRQTSSLRASQQRRAYHEARLSKAEADKACAGQQTPTIVIELPASLVRPREAT